MTLSLMITAILAAFFTLISPCILPILPVYFSIISGFNIDDYKTLKDDKLRRKKLIKNTIIGTFFFILGFSVIFILLGTILFGISHTLKQNRFIFEKISSIIIFLFGLYILFQDKIKFIYYEYKPFANLKIKKGNIFSSFILGLSLSFGWTPCISPFLGTILLSAASSNNALKGFFLLIIYCFTLLIFFIFIGLIFAFFTDKFKLISKKSKIIKVISGILLMITGGLIFFNLF
ncbi:MAG: cytochrome c biogenesis CcdA family protein [Exilispira sp.]